MLICEKYNPFFCEGLDCCECEYNEYTEDELMPCSGACEDCPHCFGSCCEYELLDMLGTDDMTNCH